MSTPADYHIIGHPANVCLPRLRRPLRTLNSNTGNRRLGAATMAQRMQMNVVLLCVGIVHRARLSAQYLSFRTAGALLGCLSPVRQPSPVALQSPNR
ncbi:hypothetical protein HRbin36_01194 [bacterium HR36]|nr:hypothetical protein HRbin36_01194 [bacterium HR36]